MIAALSALFLPRGFPGTVSSDYVAYQLWDTLQGLMSYLKGVVLTFSFLRGIGVGADGSLEGAVLVWIVRDATAMCAGLAAGVPVFTDYCAQRENVHTCRMVAESIRAVMGLLELAASTLEPRYFLMLTIIAAIGNAVAGVMSGQTRAALMTHFALADNIADCAAKEGNQDRGVKLFGIAAAVAFLNKLGENQAASWVAYCILTTLHLVFNTLAMRALTLQHAADDGEGRKLNGKNAAEEVHESGIANGKTKLA